MRVEAYNSVAQIYKTNRAAGASAAAKTEKSRDQVEISSIGYDYQIAKQAVKDTEDVREDKVNKYKDAIASGTYNVSSQEIAEKMVSKYFDTLF